MKTGTDGRKAGTHQRIDQSGYVFGKEDRVVADYRDGSVLDRVGDIVRALGMDARKSKKYRPGLAGPAVIHHSGDFPLVTSPLGGEILQLSHASMLASAPVFCYAAFSVVMAAGRKRCGTACSIKPSAGTHYGAATFA